MYSPEAHVGVPEPRGDTVGFSRTPELASSPYVLMKCLATPHGSLQERSAPVPVRRPLAGARPCRVGRGSRPLLLPPQTPGARARVGAADGVDVPGQRTRPAPARSGALQRAQVRRLDR